MPDARPSASSANATFESAPRAALTAMSLRVLTMSGRFRRPEVNVPTTKPICTAITSHAAPPDESPQSAWMAGVTPDELNQSVIARSRASASNMRFRHWRIEPSTFNGAGLLGLRVPDSSNWRVRWGI